MVLRLLFLERVWRGLRRRIGGIHGSGVLRRVIWKRQKCGKLNERFRDSHSRLSGATAFISLAQNVIFNGARKAFSMDFSEKCYT
jgi:hypothetical protein